MGGSQRAGIFHCPYSDSLTTESRWSSEAVPLCTVLDARAIPYTLDPTGRVRSGRIVLYGPVCENPFGRVLTRLAAGTAENGSSAWVRRDDPDENPLEKTKPFELDIPEEELAADSILLRLFRDFALILERVYCPVGKVLHRRIGWCIVGGALNAKPSFISPEIFQKEEVVTII